MYNVFICDDDLDCLRSTATLVSKELPCDNIKTFGNAESLLVACKSQPPDIVLCDICLSTDNGISVTEQICKTYPKTQIIYISGFANTYFEQVYRVPHVHLLDKPVKIDLLRDAIQRAKTTLQGLEAKYITVKIDTALRKIYIEDILYAEICDRYSQITTVQEQIQTKSRFDDLLRQLGSNFSRCHHSIAVNLNKIFKLENYKISFENGKTINISRRYSTSLKADFNRFMGSVM